MMVTEWMAGALILTGSFLVLVATIGLLRLPDVLCRSHAVGKAMTLGVSLLLIALFFIEPVREQGFRILLILIFQFLTIPISAHLLCRLALQKDVARWKKRPMDRHDSAKADESRVLEDGSDGKNVDKKSERDKRAHG